MARGLSASLTQLEFRCTTKPELVLEELTIMRGGEAGLGGRAGPISFVAHRSTGDESYIVKEADAVVMRDGKLQVKVGPNELLTLRSAPDAARTVQ